MVDDWSVTALCASALPFMVAPVCKLIAVCERNDFVLQAIEPHIV
jgi:hypothetical protein